MIRGLDAGQLAPFYANSLVSTYLHFFKFFLWGENQFKNCRFKAKKICHSG